MEYFIKLTLYYTRDENVFDKHMNNLFLTLTKSRNRQVKKLHEIKTLSCVLHLHILLNNLVSRIKTVKTNLAAFKSESVREEKYEVAWLWDDLIKLKVYPNTCVMKFHCFIILSDVSHHQGSIPLAKSQSP